MSTASSSRAPIANVSGSNFEVLVGFDVTPEMAAFNQAGKRFRANAGAHPRRRRRRNRRPMTDLAAALGEAASPAFAEIGLEARFGRVTPSDRPELADFQVNGALAAAKAAGRNPREIAAAVAERLSGDPRLASVEVAGPGFVNLRVTDAALAARAAAMASDDRAGAGKVAHPRRVMIDYGGPNVAKEMHVGHLRSSIIGESLKRICRFRGDDGGGRRPLRRLGPADGPADLRRVR